jgi:hypothetical protein
LWYRRYVRLLAGYIFLFLFLFLFLFHFPSLLYNFFFSQIIICPTFSFSTATSWHRFLLPLTHGR